MSLQFVNPREVIDRYNTFDSIIDARSESEHALDHLPGAINWPTLNDSERQAIGTMYKQVNAFEAKKRGAAIAARNIASHIETHVLDKPRAWAPLAYCWRGGKRSGALSLILDQIGFRVSLVEGGYKAFRAEMLLDIERLAGQLQFKVICGTTGSGKTRLLQALLAQGAQVLDLEDLAQHRSSGLGAIPGQAQPSQKRFDTMVWDALRGFDPERPVFVESESKKVGNVAIHMGLLEAMRASACVFIELPLPERVALLLEDYTFFLRTPEYFCQRLEALTAQRGKRSLLTDHYDPVYLQSMQRNFVQYAQAQRLNLSDRGVSAVGQAAAGLV